MSELEEVRAIVNDNDSEMNNLPERKEISRPKTCGAAHNSSNSSSSSTSSHQLDDGEKMKQRAELLYPTMKDNEQTANNKVFSAHISKDVYKELNKKNDFSNFLENLYTQPPQQQYKVMQNSLINQIAVDYIDNSLLKELAIKNFGTETAENLLMSKKDTYLNTEYTHEHLIFNNYKELSSDLRNYFKGKITSQIGANKLEDTKGIYINAEHQSSKNLVGVLTNHKEFIKDIAKNRKSLKLGNSINSSIQFSDKNFRNAIGKADIRNMHINQNGDLDLLITDIYDFNPNSQNDLIQVGRDRQEKGEIIPYFYIYHVIIPKNAKMNENKIK